MRITATTVCRGKVQKVRAGGGATLRRTEDRATLESDPSADPEAGMAGERKRSPPSATRCSPKKRNPSSRHQSAKLRGLGQSPRTCASVRRSATLHHPGWLGYTVHLHNQVSYPTQSRPWRGLTPQPGREPEKLTGKYREKIGGKDPGALQSSVIAKTLDESTLRVLYWGMKTLASPRAGSSPISGFVRQRIFGPAVCPQTLGGVATID